MKHIQRLTALLALLSLAACGTFQVSLIPGPSPTPYVNPTATPVTFAIPPEQCAQYKSDASLPAEPDDPHSYIGGHYEELDLPEGLAFKAAVPLDDEHFMIWVSRPGFDMEFITQVTCSRPDGTRYSSILDAIRLPAETTGYGHAGFCLPDRSSGPFIVLGKYDRSQPQVTLDPATGWAMTDLDFGMSVDLGSMSFVPYPTDDLQCLRLERP